MKNNRGTLLITTGLLLVAAAVFLTAGNYYEAMLAGKSATETVSRLEELLPERTSAEETGSPDYVLYPEMEMPVKNINGQDYIGILTFPSLKLELPIISEWSYLGLKIAPCRYEGSAYTGDFIIVGHNYYSHFGRLKTLCMGDTVIFTDMVGNVFAYEVIELETLLPTSIQELESGDWDLTLITCDISGKSRIIVRCAVSES